MAAMMKHFETDEDYRHLAYLGRYAQQVLFSDSTSSPPGLNNLGSVTN